MSLFHTLDSFPVSCIYALVDETSKGMYVYFSENNAIVQLSQAIIQLKRGLHNSSVIQEAYRANRLTVKVLKDYAGNPPVEAIIRAECAHIVRDSGYTDLRGVHVPAYRIKTRIFRHYGKSPTSNPLVYVMAQSTTRDAIVMGIFDNTFDANDWIAATFGSADSVGIIPSFALNERTREYHELHGHKLIKRREYSIKD